MGSGGKVREESTASDQIFDLLSRPGQSLVAKCRKTEEGGGRERGNGGEGRCGAGTNLE